MSKNHNGYIPINSEDLEKQMVAIEECWKTYFAKISEECKKDEDIGEIKYSVNSVALREIVERVYQRKDYFVRYHSCLVMSEFKEIGLNMFWISKFKPFHISGKLNIDRLAFDINDDFALFHMFTALKALADRLGCNYDAKKLPFSLYYEMSYCLTFRDLSKESLGLLVELVARIMIPDLPTEDSVLKAERDTKI